MQAIIVTLNYNQCMTYILDKKNKNMKQQIKSFLIILPIIMILLIAGGAFLGNQLSQIWGITDSLMWALLFTTLGFFISILVSILIIKMKIDTKE